MLTKTSQRAGRLKTGLGSLKGLFLACFRGRERLAVGFSTGWLCFAIDRLENGPGIRVLLTSKKKIVPLKE